MVKQYCEWSPRCVKGPGKDHTCVNMNSEFCQRNKDILAGAGPVRWPTHLLDQTLAERGKEYGDFGVMCGKIQAIKHAMNLGAMSNGLTVTHREALEMIATKIGRILTGNPNHEDSWRDIAGYATLVADRIPKAPAATPPDPWAAIKIPDGWYVAAGSGDQTIWGYLNDDQTFTGSIQGLHRHLGLKP